MFPSYLTSDFEVVRNPARCTNCRICEKQCANGVHSYNAELKAMVSDETKCVDCLRCVTYCPTRALKIVKNDCCFRENENWTSNTIKEIYKQADSGGVLLSSMGNPKPLPVYWDRILINASQVTNPPIDPLREPMETKVFLGKKPTEIKRNPDGSLDTKLSPQLELAMPVMFSAMSYGSISYNAHKSLAKAAELLGICYNTGEGGLHEDFYCFGENTVVQVASGRMDATLESAMNYGYDLYNNGLIIDRSLFDWSEQPQFMGEKKELYYIVGAWAVQSNPDTWTTKIDPANLGIAPVPSPAGSENYIGATLDGWCLCKGAANPEGVALFAECNLLANKDPDAIAIGDQKSRDDFGWSDELIEINKEINAAAKANPVVDLATGVSSDVASLTTDGGDEIGLRAAYHGVDWATNREEISAVVSTLVEEADSELQSLVG